MGGGGQVRIQQPQERAGGYTPLSVRRAAAERLAHVVDPLLVEPEAVLLVRSVDQVLDVPPDAESGGGGSVRNMERASSYRPDRFLICPSEIPGLARHATPSCPLCLCQLRAPPSQLAESSSISPKLVGFVRSESCDTRGKSPLRLGQRSFETARETVFGGLAKPAARAGSRNHSSSASR